MKNYQFGKLIENFFTKISFIIFIKLVTAILWLVNKQNDFFKGFI